MDGSKLNPTTLWPSLDDVPGWTDKYFRRTREVVLRFGDSQVTYAVFMRRPVLYAAALACEWLKSMGKSVARRSISKSGFAKAIGSVLANP